MAANHHSAQQQGRSQVKLYLKDGGAVVPALEKHTELTVDKECTVQCFDRGTLLEDVKRGSIFGTGHVTSPMWHGWEWNWNIVSNSGSPFVLTWKKMKEAAEMRQWCDLRPEKNALRWKMEKAWCLVYHPMKDDLIWCIKRKKPLASSEHFSLAQGVITRTTSWTHPRWETQCKSWRVRITNLYYHCHEWLVLIMGSPNQARTPRWDVFIVLSLV